MAGRGRIRCGNDTAHEDRMTVVMVEVVGGRADESDERRLERRAGD
jgi:hypothetical protein